jgi:omega-hydroxy-beta-dihydromenaquinone-9 sulfotransferase
LNKTKQIFIVGSSRSGTTMMGRILGNHQSVFTFKELHFFGTLWTNNSESTLDRKQQIDLLSRLFCIEKNGLFQQGNISDFNDKASAILVNKNVLNPLSIYELFLEKVTSDNKCFIACDQTPKNMYYLNEILSYFPNAKVINMVRDQRDVLLSQKNKWKRRFLGASTIPLSEAIRSYINYHPILTAKVWSSSLEYSAELTNNNRVRIIRFEELLVEPVRIVKDLCQFLEIDYHQEMLKVPVVGSSTQQDANSQLLIDISKLEKWKNGGLNSAEIYLSQLMSNCMMRKFKYDLQTIKFPPILTLFYLTTLPIKLVLTFILNIKRMGNVGEVFKKIFFIK